jgi:hypothetical protein
MAEMECEPGRGPQQAERQNRDRQFGDAAQAVWGAVITENALPALGVDGVIAAAGRLNEARARLPVGRLHGCIRHGDIPFSARKIDTDGSASSSVDRFWEKVLKRGACSGKPKRPAVRPSVDCPTYEQEMGGRQEARVTKAVAPRMHPPTFAVHRPASAISVWCLWRECALHGGVHPEPGCERKRAPSLLSEQMTRLTGGGICQLFQLVGGQKHDLVPVTVSKRHFDEPKRLSLVRRFELTFEPLSRFAVQGIRDHKGSLNRMAVEALERAEFVTSEAWRNTGDVHLGLTVLAARTRQHAKGRIGRQCVRVGHVRPPLDQAGARQLPDTGFNLFIFTLLKRVCWSFLTIDDFIIRLRRSNGDMRSLRAHHSILSAQARLGSDKTVHKHLFKPNYLLKRF